MANIAVLFKICVTGDQGTGHQHALQHLGLAERWNAQGSH
jgi:hypothetical protein